MNNAHLKLNSMSEFTALWNSGEKFQKFAEQVYRYLERMKTRYRPGAGTLFGRAARMDHKTACVFYLGTETTAWSMNFNEDYTAVVHRHVDPDVKEWILSRCKHRV